MMIHLVRPAVPASRSAAIMAEAAFPGGCFF